MTIQDRKISFFSSACIAVLGAAMATAASAQSPPSQAQTLEEVVVTAQRRSENLQTVPIAATVLGGEELAERGITNIQGLETAAAGLSIQPPGSGETYINIRGVGTFLTSLTTSAALTSSG